MHDNNILYTNVRYYYNNTRPPPNRYGSFFSARDDRPSYDNVSLQYYANIIILRRLFDKLYYYFLLRNTIFREMFSWLCRKLYNTNNMAIGTDRATILRLFLTENYYKQFSRYTDVSWNCGKNAT